MTDDKEHFDDPALEALLAQATWPEPTPASTRRLIHFYRSQRGLTIDRRWLLAASLLIACGIAFATLRWKSKPEVATPQPLPPVHVEPSTAPQPDIVATRAPTPLELALITAADREAKRPRLAAPRQGSVQDALHVIVAHDDAATFARATGTLASIDPERREADLARTIAAAGPPESRVAARLVAHFATPDSLPLLLEMDRSPALRDVAIPALARVSNPGLLKDLVRSHTRPDHRRTLIAGLLDRRATSQYLDLVSDPTTASDALAALDPADPPSTDAFFAALADPHVSVRLAAAKVLGRIDGPETTARLVALAQRPQCRREALIALADSRGPEARQFLNQAKSSGPLAGAVRSILLEQSAN